MRSKLKYYTLIANITLLDSVEGGRKKPVYTGYRPSFIFKSSQHYSGEITLLGKKLLNPGETTRVEIKLLPTSSLKRLKPMEAFTISEGTKKIGDGIINEVSSMPSWE